MDPERWRQVADLLEEVRELPEQEREQRLLNEDEHLRREVISLLAADTGGLDFLESSTTHGLTEGDMLGGYRVQKLLGEGGMGAVYLAFQEEQIKRPVAIKVVGGLALGPEGHKRFQLEQGLLARMSHAYIARLYETNLTGKGPPFFVMEYIEGLPITHYCDQHQLGLEARLDLFGKVCQGLAHAHLKGVLHRDIKASNILVTEENGQPIPKIIDFGIAKPLEAGPDLTRTGTTPGTFRYMSPEQAGALDPDGNPYDLDFRTDIYALGVLLYELLTGQPPLSWKANVPPANIYKDIATRLPQPPERLWRQLPPEEQTTRAARFGATAKTHQRQLKGDLGWMVLKALEKDPEQRYHSAEMMRLDIQRFRDGRPIEARAPTLAYLLKKLVRRHKLATLTTALALVFATGFTTVILVQKEALTVERDKVAQEVATLEQVTNFLSGMFKAASPYNTSSPATPRGAGVTVRQMVDQAAADIRGGLKEQPKIRARLMVTLGTVYQDLQLPAEACTLLADAIAIQQELFGEQGHLDMATNLEQLSRLYQGMHDLEEAEKPLLRALKMRRGLQGESHRAIAATLLQLSTLRLLQKDWDEAVRLCRQGLDMLQAHEDPQHLDIGDAKNKLAWMYHQRGRFNQAEPLYMEALSIYRGVYGDAHPKIGNFLNNVGGLRFDNGAYADAEASFREALAIQRTQLDENHFQLIQSLTNLARCYNALARYEEAESLAREGMEAYKKLRGAYNPGGLVQLGEALMGQGRYEEARDYLEEGRAAYTYYKKRGLWALMADAAWAKNLTHFGQKDEAVSLLKEAQKVLAARPYDGPHYQDLVTRRLQFLEPVE